MEQEKLCFNAFELAMRTGLSVSFIRKMTREGRIPYLRVGRRILYPISEIEKWLVTSISDEGNEK